MAQEQKKVNSQEVSSKSFDDILERMRSRVSEISDQGRVRQILDEEQPAIADSTTQAPSLNEGEQDRAFTEMSKQILAKPDGTVSEEGNENSTDMEDDSKDTLTVEAPEYVAENKEEAETYNQILEALQMKDLSSLRSSEPSEIEKIIQLPAEALPESSNMQNEDHEDAATSDSDEPENAIASSEDISEGSVESKAVTEEIADTKQQEDITKTENAEEQTQSATDGASNNKKKDYTLAFDRLTKIASTMGKSLEEKAAQGGEMPAAAQSVTKEQPETDTPTPALEEAKAASEKSVEAAVEPVVKEEAVVEPVKETAKAAPVEKVVSAEPNPLFAVFEERNAKHNKRLDHIEQAIQSLAQSHEEMEKRSLEMFQKQEESLRLVTRESQKVAEATATKLSEKIAAQVEIKTKEEHAVLRADMETVQTGLLELVSQFEGSAKSQNSAYEMMQSSLVSLHEKMNDFSAEQEKMRAEQIAMVQAVPEKTVTDHIQAAFKAESPMPVRKPERKEVNTENLSLSSQVLRNFVNAPLVQHPVKSDEEPASLFGKKNAQPPMSAPAQPAIHSSFSNAEGHNETILVDKNQKSSKAPVLLAISSMFMFSVAGFLFYDHYQKQGLQRKLASNTQVIEKTIASNAVVGNGSGLIGEKKIVEWSYSGAKKANVAQLSKADKALDRNGINNFKDVTSNTEIIEVAGNSNNAPLTTSSIGGNSALNLATDNIKRKKGNFKKPSVLIGSSSLRQAAGKGISSAMFEVARRYQNGKGVKKNYKEAVKWYRRAAEKDYAPAQYRLGTLYERGRGVKKDIESARDWYRRSAKLGNVKAMHNLGVIFSGQKKIRPDYALAIQWFTKAAKYGLADSQFNLAIINYNGLGKKKDIVEAYKWFALASKNGDKAAKEQKDTIAQKMKLKQIMDARKKANSWKNKAIPVKANIDLSKKYSWQDFAEL